MSAQLLSPRMWIVLVCSIVVLVLVSACASPTPKPTPTLTLDEQIAAFPTLTPIAVKNVEQVTKSWHTSQFMDNKHLSKGLSCNVCHTAMPPQGAPKSEVCLGCHGASYEAMAEKTSKLTPNPHKSHLGEPLCADCHYSHEPFVFKCRECHFEFTNTRFIQADVKPSGGDTKPGTGMPKPGVGTPTPGR